MQSNDQNIPTNASKPIVEQLPVDKIVQRSETNLNNHNLKDSIEIKLEIDNHEVDIISQLQEPTINNRIKIEYPPLSEVESKGDASTNNDNIDEIKFEPPQLSDFDCE